MSEAMPTPPESTWEEKITPGRFAGKVAIVTGAGSGIGLATALRIAKEGGRVIAADVSQPRLDALVAENPNLDITAVLGDISKQEDVDAIVAAAGERIDCLVNNAGIMDNFTPIHECSDAVWERVFRINVTGMFMLTRAVVPFMLKQGAGSIVNISSEAGLRASAAGAAYTASKHAVIGLTKSGAFMYKNAGIRVNSVAPGAVKTNIEAPFESAFSGPIIQKAMANIPTFAEASHLASAICYLLSDDAVNLTGVILPSDGGWSVV